MSKVKVRPALVLFVVAVFTGSRLAQRGEIYPNAGFIWSTLRTILENANFSTGVLARS
jgi:hypothetical protein